MRLAGLVVVALAGCSSPSFEVAPPADAGVEDAGVVDSMEAGDACRMGAPPSACTRAELNPAVEISVPGSAVVHRLKPSAPFLVHMKMPRDGRLGKVVLRMNLVAFGTAPSLGNITMFVYTRACEPHLLGKSTVPVSSRVEWEFDLGILPTVKRGEDLDLIVGTDSLVYHFDVLGGSLPEPNPHELFWAKKEGAGEWMILTSSLPAFSAYTLGCGG
jgi:hypothetical protein